ncbi:MAG TPA: glycosyltransferase family 39 protein [Stellaceae bacterium]|nr:glycosyltransferase family 39 protein [Stellaceae bacterium]
MVTFSAPAAAPDTVAARPAPVLAGSALWMLAAVTLGGAGLRFYHLDHLSLWTDEAFSRFYYQTGLHFMWTEGLRRESSPPLYYMALGGWIGLFGSSEAALRSLSAIASTAAIPLVYGLARELLERRQALVAAALFALSPTAIYYAQEARPYALLLLPVLATLMACARLLRRRGGTANFALYIAGATASLYTHTTMFLFAAACGGAVLAAAWAARPHPSGKFFAAWIASNAVVGLLAAPLLVSMAQPSQLRQLAWIPPLNWHDFGAVISNTVAGTLTPGHFPGALLAMLVVAVLVLSLRRDPPPSRMLVVALLIPGLYAALVILVSATLQPILLGRIFSWTVVALCLIEARATLASGWQRPLAIGVVAATTSIGLAYQIAAPADAKEPWRGALHTAASELTRADLVALAPDTDPAAVMYYAPPVAHIAMWASQAMAPAQLGIMPGLFGIPGMTRDTIARRIGEGARVTLVARASDEAALAGLLGAVPPPATRLDRPCVGGDGNPTRYPCGITVLSWGPR